jgi:hypothetical protein
MNAHGLAAIHIIEKNLDAALKLYRETLATDRDIEVDSLQKIHALHNLQFVIKLVAQRDVEGVSQVMRDEELRKLAEKEEELSGHFLIKFRLRQDDARHQLEQLGEELESPQLHVRKA